MEFIIGDNYSAIETPEHARVNFDTAEKKTETTKIEKEKPNYSTKIFIFIFILFILIIILYVLVDDKHIIIGITLLVSTILIFYFFFFQE